MSDKPHNIDLSKVNAARSGHNYFMEQRGGEYVPDDLNVLNNYVNYILTGSQSDLPKYKVGLMFIAINPPYWQYTMNVIDGAKKFFAPGHDVEILLYSDIPEVGSPQEKALIDSCPSEAEIASMPTEGRDPQMVSKEYVQSTVAAIRSIQGVTIYPVDSAPWPYPTLMRYHLMLQQEEALKKFDYIFYLDLDMHVVNVVGDEIFGDGLTAAQHPMYAVRKEYVPPYEPNPVSAAYIPRPGRIVLENDRPRFEPLYFAGGFQGGKTEEFIKSMHSMKKMVTADMNQNYVPIWNDESIWNKHLFENQPAVVLSPSYIYPDSLIKEYYEKIWGKSYVPRIITITKKFTTDKSGGDAVAKMIQTL